MAEQLFTEDVEVHSDGGGKVAAARVVIQVKQKAARFLAGGFHKRRHCEMRSATVNGERGLVFSSENRVVQVMSLRIKQGVRAVFMTLNPDKLSRWSTAEIQ